MGRFRRRLEPILREQPALFALILACVLVFAADRLGADAWTREHLAAKPGNLEQTWHDLTGGSFTWQAAATLLTLVTSAFVHSDFVHLGFNMLYLWIFGFLVSRLVGQWWMLAIFLVTAVTGVIGHTLLNLGDLIPLVGASGGISGLQGAYLGMFIRWRLPNPDVWPLAHPIPPIQLLALVALGLFIDYTSIMSNVESATAFGAHLGGFLGGVFVGSFLLVRPNGIEAR